MNATDKNAHYGNLNTRFDNRLAALYKLGFRQNGSEFKMRKVFGAELTFSNAAILYCDEIVWGDMLEQAERFAAV